MLAFMTLISESLFCVTVEKMVGVDDQRTNLLITVMEEQPLQDWMGVEWQSENGQQRKNKALENPKKRWQVVLHPVFQYSLIPVVI